MMVDEDVDFLECQGIKNVFPSIPLNTPFLTWSAWSAKSSYKHRYIYIY